MAKGLSKEEQNLVDFIKKKERREKWGKWNLTILISISLLLISLLGGGYYYYSQLEQTEDIPVHILEDLTRSKVASLLENEPYPLIVLSNMTGQKDTIQSVQEFMLLLAASRDPATLVHAQESGELNPDLNSVGLDSLADSTDRSQRTIPTDLSQPFVEADVMPSFPGGEVALYRYLSSHLRYPTEALKNKIEGKVFVRFIIEPDGSISDLKVRKGLGFGCDEEALRVVKLMPGWIPGEIQGVKVPVYSSLAINFKFL